MTQNQNIDKWLKTRCVGCGRCCTETIVPVTDADVRRLMKATGQPASEIVRFFGPDDVDWDADDGHWVETQQGPRFLALKKAKERCQFLDDQKRCMVYEDRPITCRTFPLQIFLDETESRIEKITLNRIVKTNYPRAEKPLKTKKTATQQAQQEDREDRVFQKKVAFWNRQKNKGDFLAFLNFLRLE